MRRARDREIDGGAREPEDVARELGKGKGRNGRAVDSQEQVAHSNAPREVSGTSGNQPLHAESQLLSRRGLLPRLARPPVASHPPVVLLFPVHWLYQHTQPNLFPARSSIPRFTAQPPRDFRRRLLLIDKSKISHVLAHPMQRFLFPAVCMSFSNSVEQS